MDFGKIATNPMVLASGAAIGLFLLLHKAPAAAEGVGVNTSIVSGTVAMNTAALGSQVQLAGINATTAQQTYQQDTLRQAHILAYLQGVDNNQSVLARTQIQSQAGITNSLITTSAMMAIDVQNNSNRLALAMQETQNERIRANAQVDVAALQLEGQKAAAHAALLGSIFGGVTKLASAAITKI